MWVEGGLGDKRKHQDSNDSKKCYGTRWRLSKRPMRCQKNSENVWQSKFEAIRIECFQLVCLPYQYYNLWCIDNLKELLYDYHYFQIVRFLIPINSVFFGGTMAIYFMPMSINDPVLPSVRVNLDWLDTYAKLRRKQKGRPVAEVVFKSIFMKMFAFRFEFHEYNHLHKTMNVITDTYRPNLNSGLKKHLELGHEWLVISDVKL